MNKKGETNNAIGLIIAIAITLIVGTILLVGSAQNMSLFRNTVTVVNDTITAPANGGIYNFTDYKALSSFAAINTTDGLVIGAGNYTVTNNQIVDGAEVAQLTIDDAEYDLYQWNVSYIGQSSSYGDSASRAMGGLVIIFFALAIAVVALVPTLRSKVLDSMKNLGR